jgi:hypothetical protein
LIDLIKFGEGLIPQSTSDFGDFSCDAVQSEKFWTLFGHCNWALDTLAGSNAMSPQRQQERARPALAGRALEMLQR